MPKITAHGEERLRKRIGIPARATERSARNAKVRGKKRTEFSGPVRRYLDKLHYRGKLENKATDIVVYGQVIYLFAGEYLLTCWRLPNKFLKQTNAQRIQETAS